MFYYLRSRREKKLLIQRVKLVFPGYLEWQLGIHVSVRLAVNGT